MENSAYIEFLKAVNKVQGLIEPVVKDSTNPHFKSKFASLIAVNEVVMPVLSKNGLVLFQGGHDIGGKPYLRTTLSHITGHSESFYYPLSLDVNPQHTAAQVTYARRNSICALLNLSVDDDDAEGAVDRAPKTAEKPVAAHKPKESQSEQLYDFSFIPELITSKSGETNGKPWTRYSIKMNGEFFSTFDEAISEQAHQAKENNLPLEGKYKFNASYKQIVSAAMAVKL